MISFEIHPSHCKETVKGANLIGYLSRRHQKRLGYLLHVIVHLLVPLVHGGRFLRRAVDVVQVFGRQAPWEAHLALGGHLLHLPNHVHSLDSMSVAFE